LVEYARHEPEKTLLHRVLREPLEPFLARTARRPTPLPGSSAHPKRASRRAQLEIAPLGANI